MRSDMKLNFLKLLLLLYSTDAKVLLRHYMEETYKTTEMNFM